MLKYYKYKFLKILGLVSKDKYAKKTAKYTMQYKAIAKSKYFNKKWYLKQNPDVAKTKVDPVQHYLTKGWKEGRNPSAKFNTNTYLNANPDVKRVKMNPLFHYVKYGKKEGRLSEKWIDYNIIENSEYFDRQYYLDKNADVAKAELDPIRHYLLYGWKEGRNPSAKFDANMYLYINKDVKQANMNPLIHFEKYGKRQMRSFDLSEFNLEESHFDEKLKSTKNKFNLNETKFHRLAIFSSFNAEGKIPEYVLYYLKGLREVVDNIIFIADNPIDENEIEKIKDLVCYAEFKRHSEYDFGSYKRGFLYAKENALLDEVDELVFVNDSCYGPVFPFSQAFDTMKAKQVDFWGMSFQTNSNVAYIQSFFLALKKQVFNSVAFLDFIQNIKALPFRESVVVEYEFKFTKLLESKGFKWGTYASEGRITMTDNPLLSMKKYKYPLVKVKALLDLSANDSNISEAINFIRKNNKELYDIILPFVNEGKILLEEKKIQYLNKKISIKDNIIALNKHQENSLKNKLGKGEKIRVAFLVNMTSMFPGQALFEEMIKDDSFDAKIVIAPESRFGKNNENIKIQTQRELEALYSKEYIFDNIDANGSYIDIVPYFDLVCMPSPYRVSSVELYNQLHFLHSDIPMFHIDYGFLRSIYDRFIISANNYSFFWKVFVQTPQNLEEVKEYAITKGENALITGYAKMDRFAKYTSKSKRKTIIIAPHHSVEGGFNDTLSLSNFASYYKLYLSLPKRYPEIDFILRPHPVLFIALVTRGIWTQAECDNYRADFLSNANAFISEGGDYFQNFIDSDGIINDCGSYLVEYFYTKKPQLYLLKDKADIEDKFVKLGKQCLENCYIGYKEEDIIDFIDNIIIKEQDPMKLAREKFSEEVVMLNYPNASSKIINHIKERLLK